MIAANDQLDRPPTPAELDLIAYLDGELDESKVAEVEGRIATDPIYAAMLRELLALGDFVREDGDRIYGKANVDDIADSVMSGIQRASALPPSSQLVPMSSVATRRKKNSVIWVAFGTVAAAAAALFFYVQGQKTVSPTVATTAKTADTVAVKTTAQPPSKDPLTVPPAVEPKHSLEVEDLEVGEGATVIYTTGDQGESAPVVWINAKPNK
jgi:anti-sigma factor RsiW